MSTDAFFEHRLEAVEFAVAELQRKLSSTKVEPNWLDQVIGSMKDEPEFEKVLEYGRQIRFADRPDEDEVS